MIGIGIDTGGTYTDAVLYDTETHKVLASGKSLTTRRDLKIGIVKALDQLDQKKMKDVGMIALSTTLATNAALENIGGRAKCLMLGMSQKYMTDAPKTYAQYGLDDFSQLVFMDARPENVYSNPEEPDWNLLREKASEWFAGCHSVGVVQTLAYADGGKLESKAKMLLQELGYQVTTSHEMFNDSDVLKCGAATLLNARLVPIIAEFIASVKEVLAERHLDVPIAIVRSDGSLMSEEMARINPVETLLSGPAASSIGGSSLAREENAVVVDMGGTTTDVALVRNQHPIRAAKGIRIGGWDTAVKGLYVDTFLLGGDSAVRFEKEQLYLDGRRVIPISVLAAQYPEVKEKLRVFAGRSRRHTRMLHEFLVLQREPDPDVEYTPQEHAILNALRHGPLMLEELAEQIQGDIYHLEIKRLENEGILIFGGITPTDAMVLKGDFAGYDPEPAQYALQFLSNNVRETLEELPDAIYHMVLKKMYCNIVRILLEQKYPKGFRYTRQEGVSRLIEWSFEESYAGRSPEWMSFPVSTNLPLVGVGAPIHIFLPKVAEFLGTRAVICDGSAVANAIGAIASNVVTRLTARVKAEYDKAEFMGYSVFEGDKRILFSSYEKAEKHAIDLLKEQVRARARLQGSGEEPNIEIQVHEVNSRVGMSSMFFESIIEAVATDLFQI